MENGDATSLTHIPDFARQEASESDPNQLEYLYPGPSEVCSKVTRSSSYSHLNNNRKQTRMPREIISLQAGQAGNQSQSEVSPQKFFTKLMS